MNRPPLRCRRRDRQHTRGRQHWQRLLPDDDAGNAVVEFLGVSLLLLVPVVYLVLVLGQLQAAAFGVDGAAREAARAYVTAADPAEAPGRSHAAVNLALGDQGFSGSDASVSVSCSADCREPGSTVTVTVELDVPLVGVPSVVQHVVPLVVPVSAVATAQMDTFRGGDHG